MKFKTPKTMKKAAANLIWLAAAAAASLVLYFYMQTDSAKTAFNESAGIGADGKLAVHFIDVGHGDAAVITAPDGTSMLIDSGPNSAEDVLRSYIDSLGIKSFAYIVFTHPHEDHIGGGDMVLQEYSAGTVIMPDAATTTVTFDRLVDAIENSGAKVIAANDVIGMTYTLGSATAAPEFTILAPRTEGYSNLNNNSVVLRIDYGSSSFLFTGDAEKESESDQIKMFGAKGLPCDVLKVGHHGSATSTTLEYLNAVSPKAAVISCAKINEYGHPHAETLEKLEHAGVKTYITGELGSIVIYSDGTNITAVTK